MRRACGPLTGRSDTTSAAFRTASSAVTTTVSCCHAAKISSVREPGPVGEEVNALVGRVGSSLHVGHDATVTPAPASPARMEREA